MQRAMASVRYRCSLFSAGPGSMRLTTPLPRVEIHQAFLAHLFRRSFSRARSRVITVGLGASKAYPVFEALGDLGEDRPDLHLPL